MKLISLALLFTVLLSSCNSDEQEDPSAQARLAYYYLYEARDTGRVEEAIGLLESAAAQGNANAVYELGRLHYLGDVVPINYPEAIAWLLQGVALNEPYSQLLLGQMYIQGIGVAENRVLGESYMAMSAESGLATAQYALAKLYLSGEIIE